MSHPTPFMPGPGTPGLVSVIIPTYNRQEFVGVSIASALAQTYPNFEAIVVDDGSTDATRAEVSRFTDPRVRYYYKANGGLSSARNFGLDQSAGEFIAFLDSDDLWRPWKLAAQIELFRRHPDVGMSWSDMSTFRRLGEIIDERALRIGYAAYEQVKIEQVCARMGTLRDLCATAPIEYLDCPYYVGQIFNEMFLGNLVHPPTAIVRRDVLRTSGPFDTEVTGHGGDDYHFYYRVCEAGPVALLDAPAILYRLHKAQISVAHSLNEARADLRIVTHWLNRRPPAFEPPVIRARVASAHRWVGEAELDGGDPRRAVEHLWKSFVLDPARPRVLLLLVASLIPRSAMPFARVAKRWMLASKAQVLLRLAGLSSLLYLLLRFFLLEPEVAEVSMLGGLATFLSES